MTEEVKVMSMSWAEARTLRDFGECQALWQERRLPPMPAAHPEARISLGTDRPLPLIPALNRSGRFFVTGWQPGCLPDSQPLGGIMEEQRAAVMGFVPGSAILQFRDACPLSDAVEVKIRRPGSSAEKADQLVGRTAGRHMGWFGYILDPLQILQRYERLARSVIVSLQGCYQVSVVESQWGSNELLWPALHRLLC